jgi:hypothetical protein
MLRGFLFIAIAATLLGLVGCGSIESEKPSDSTLPQAQPASWQGGLPGMGQQGGSGYR